LPVEFVLLTNSAGVNMIGNNALERGSIEVLRKRLVHSFNARVSLNMVIPLEDLVS
jgi:hypothetical protein